MSTKQTYLASLPAMKCFELEGTRYRVLYPGGNRIPCRHLELMSIFYFAPSTIVTIQI